MIAHMTKEEEQEHWRGMVRELNAKFTWAQIAAEVGVTERQVANWLYGDRPKGLTAVRLYLFHVKQCGSAAHKHVPQYLAKP